MDVTCQGTVVTIVGNIKSIADFQTIKKNVDDVVAQNKRVDFIIADSISMTSSVIGYLTKLVYQDKVSMSMKIGDERLHQLLDDLNVTSLFGVKKG